MKRLRKKTTHLSLVLFFFTLVCSTYIYSFKYVTNLLTLILDENGNGFLPAFLDVYHGRNLVLESTVPKNITIACLFKPLDFTSMKENINDHVLSMRGLMNWQSPRVLNITINTTEMYPLLPQENTRVHDVWYMVNPAYIKADEYAYLNKRFRDEKPPKNTSASVLYYILSMFHENVFLQTRSEPRGTIAILRAQNSEFFDIIFRCHAEFQLNYPPLLPFWFTPGQFQGRLTIKRDGSEVKNFIMNVSTEHKINVDMEWMSQSFEDLEVDVGYIPEMLVHMSDAEDLNKVIWDEEISVEEAMRTLETKMFPFKEVLYKPISEALNELNAQNKPLHCVILWGALDDQSC